MVKNLPTVERSTRIRFGKHALEEQAENTIVFNASDTPLQATNPSAVYLSPIRFRQNFSDPNIVLLMYNKATGEITESGSSASTAVEPPLSSVTGFGNTTPYTIEFQNPTTSFVTSGNVHVNGDLEVQGNINFHNGTIAEIKNTDLVVEDRIIGIAHNNTQVGLDTGIIINYPNQNVGIIHHGDETPKRLSIGYTQQGSTDTSITPDANNITLDILGDAVVQNDLTVTGALAVNNLNVTNVTATGTVSATTVSGTTGTFSGAVSGTNGTFSGAVSGTSFSDGTATLTGGAWSGSAATLTTARLIGGVSFDGSADINLPGVNIGGNQNTTGSAATLTTARLIGGVAFDGSADINLPGVDATGNQNTTGSAATLTTARSIGGVLFDGSADINLPGVNTAGNQNTTGTAAGLTTAVNIGGVSFDGTSSINLPGVNATGNQNTTGSAATLTTARSIGGVLFDGSADIVPTTFGNISAADGTFTGAITGASYSGGAVSGTVGTFTGNLSGQALTVTSAQVNGALTATALITGDGGGLSNLTAANITNGIALGTNTTGNYVIDVAGGDGIAVTGTAGEGWTPSVAVDLKTNGGLVIESSKLAVDLGASSITGTLAVADGGTGVTTSTGSVNVVLSESPTLTGTLTAAIANFSGAVTGASYSGGAISGTTGTFSGDLAVDTDTLFVDSTNDRVGVNKNNPTVALDVVGDVNATGAGAFGGAVSGTTGTFSGAVSGTTGDFSGVLTVTDATAGSSNTAGAVVVSGGIAALGDIHSGDVYASATLDHTSTLGTAKIGYDGSNTGHAVFAQHSKMNGTDYALRQTGNGSTWVNAPSGQHISLRIAGAEQARLKSTGDFYVDTDTLYVDAANDRIGVNKSNPAQALDVVGSVAVSQNMTVSGLTTANDGMIINTATDGVTKKFYSYKGTLADQTSVADASLKLTFSSNIFYAKIVAHLVEDSTEFSNMSLEVGGGSRAGGATPNLKLGAVSIFGNTSTNPWDSSPDVTTTAGAIILKPTSIINNGNSGNPAALYNIFVEYITPDGTNGKLETIHVGSSATAVKTFTY
jgi:hypothetical protein